MVESFELYLKYQHTRKTAAITTMRPPIETAKLFKANKNAFINFNPPLILLQNIIRILDII